MKQNDEKLLRGFYKAMHEIHPDTPPFNSLSPENKEDLRGTLGFAGYRASKALDALVASIAAELKRIAKWLK